MTWTPAGKYAIRSDCGRYTISKTFNGSDVCRYRAWHGSKSLSRDCRTVDEAKAIAERHRAGR